MQFSATAIFDQVKEVALGITHIPTRHMFDTTPLKLEAVVGDVVANVPEDIVQRSVVNLRNWVKNVSKKADVISHKKCKIQIHVVVFCVTQISFDIFMTNFHFHPHF